LSRQVSAYAEELVSLAPDVVVTITGDAARAMQQQTHTIPIVVMGAGDVLDNGLVKNIARPEGNITGVTNLPASIGGKWLELLKEAAPQIQRVALIANAQFTSDAGSPYFPSIEGAARVFAMKAIRMLFRDDVEIARAIDAFAVEPNGGLIVGPAIAGNPVRLETILGLSLQHRLPSICGVTRYAAGGGLMSYASGGGLILRRAPFYVDRVLRGAKVSELPVEFPTTFELVINLKTARALGLTIPASFLNLADEVIE
jgi:putative tryptophan/tyrosine transport system substrate-binding protein